MQCGLRSYRPAASGSSRGSRCSCTSMLLCTGMYVTAAMVPNTPDTPSPLGCCEQALDRTRHELMARLQSGGPAELKRLRAEAADFHERLADANRDRVGALLP